MQKNPRLWTLPVDYIHKLQIMITDLQESCVSKEKIIQKQNNEIIKVQREMCDEKTKTIKAQGNQICRMIKIMDGLREP